MCKGRLHTVLRQAPITPLQLSFPTRSLPPLSPHQSMVQQLTSDGNWRSRSLKALPMGLKHSTTCRFCAHWEIEGERERERE